MIKSSIGKMKVNIKKMKTLTPEKCEELYKKYKTPEHIIRHCKTVGNVGYEIAKALSDKGMNINPELVRDAGYMHDLLRLEENHGERAAEVLVSEGFELEAITLKEHMYYDFDLEKTLDETDILCIADRVVKEDKFVGIRERIKYLIAKPGVDEKKASMLIQKGFKTEKIIKKIENILEDSLQDICREYK